MGWIAVLSIAMLAITLSVPCLILSRAIIAGVN